VKSFSSERSGNFRDNWLIAMKPSSDREADFLIDAEIVFGKIRLLDLLKKRKKNLKEIFTPIRLKMRSFLLSYFLVRAC